MNVAAQIMVAGTFRSAKGVPIAFLKALEAMATAWRTPDACEAYSVARDIFDPTLIRIFEIWRDDISYTRHST